MRKPTLARVLFLLPIALLGQSKNDTVQIRLRKLTLVGASQISPAEQQKIAAEIEKLNPATMDSASSIDEISERLRYALQKRGFFKALVSDSNVTIVGESASEEVIDANYYVELGRQYRLKQITFANNADPRKGLAFSASELRQSFPISDGEIFDTDKIRIGLEKLRQLYADHGYINCTPVPATEADEVTGTIALRLDLDEDAIFRMGKLRLEGVEPARGVGEKLLEAWKPYEGQIYSQQLLENYIHENAAHLSWKARPWPLTPADGQDHIVNFVLDFDDSGDTN